MLIFYVHHLHAVTCRSQKRALDPLEQELRAVVSHLWATNGCWDLNSGSLEEKQVLLTARSSLQPHTVLFIPFISHNFFSCSFMGNVKPVYHLVFCTLQSCVTLIPPSVQVYLSNTERRAILSSWASFLTSLILWLSHSYAMLQKRSPSSLWRHWSLPWTCFSSLLAFVLEHS